MNSEPKSDQVDAAQNASSDVLGNAHNARPASETASRYEMEVRLLTNYFRERLAVCGPLAMTDERRKIGTDSLTGLHGDLVRGSFVEWLAMRNYELSYNQTCKAFFAALALATTQDNSGS